MPNFSQRLQQLLNVELGTDLSKLPRGSKAAKVIAVCSQKGGVGKTTTTVNIAASLAKHHDLKTLIIDLDPQGHVEKSLNNLIEEGIEYATLSDLLMAKSSDLLDGIVKTKLENLHLTPGDGTLYQTEGMLTSKIGREFILDRALATARTHYDIIFIDCPPNLGNLTVNALCAASHVIIPCEMSVLAFEGVADLLDTVETITERLNAKLKILGVIFTRVDRRNGKMNQIVIDNMKKYFKGNFFNTQIFVNTDLNRAQLKGEPVFMVSPSSNGAKNYRLAADELVKKLGKKRNVAPVKKRSNKQASL